MALQVAFYLKYFEAMVYTLYSYARGDLKFCGKFSITFSMLQNGGTTK